MTPSKLGAIADDDLVLAVQYNIWSKMKRDMSDEAEVVSRLTRGRKAIYTIALLKGEVDNGGFNQFFYNPGGKFAADALDGLKLIGATKHAEIFEKCIDVYEKEKAILAEIQDGTLNGFSDSYKNNPLNDFDTLFYEASHQEELERLMQTYIRAHPLEFIDGEKDDSG